MILNNLDHNDNGEGMTTVNIYAPQATAKEAIATTCPDCKKRTRMLRFFTPWLGCESTCIKCGRKWFEGEWAALPFCRGARKNNIENAKRKWRAMPPRKDNHYGIDN